MSLEARLAWQCRDAQHLDRLRVNAPPAGFPLQAPDPARWVSPRDEAPVRLPPSAFRLESGTGPESPRAGFWYPRQAIAGLANSRHDRRPVRLLIANGQALVVDVNHPLAGIPLDVSLGETEGSAAPSARLADLFDGPGLQAPPLPWPSDASDWQRQDDGDDSDFYRRPRRVHHLDSACRGALTALHQRLLPPGSQVLDLMASWQSHLPATPFATLAGLGLNGEELAANGRLTEAVIQDLNRSPRLPWDAARFDAVVCTAAIEYLTAPTAVLAEVRRVLRPGGLMVISFSDRWFPGKAVRIWSRLHPFARLGLVLALLRDGGFTCLHSETLRGMARPEDGVAPAEAGIGGQPRDHADPLFAAWGYA